MSDHQTFDQTRYRDALTAIDTINMEDPNLDEGQPKELLYSQRMSEALLDFEPDASEALRLAARAQHIRRWAIPRADYPMDRAGYLKWRSELKKMHANTAREVLEVLGYDPEVIVRVSNLIQKHALKRDPEAQALEDVVCLVFLRHYWKPFMAKHDDDKLVEIVRKTWAKMSERAHEIAGAIDMDERSRNILRRALES